MVLKALDIRATPPFHKFSLQTQHSCPSASYAECSQKSKPEKDKLFRAISRCFPAMVALGSAPDLRDRKDKMGSFSPGLETGTGLKTVLGSWAGKLGLLQAAN